MKKRKKTSSRPHRKKVWPLAAVVLAVAGLIAVAGSFVQSQEGFFSPVFSDDGKDIYFICRQTTGIVWGAGLEFFTPPANAYILFDRVSLQRVNIASGRREVLTSWGRTPLTGQHLTAYRNRIFTIMKTSLRSKNGHSLDFAVQLRGVRLEEHRYRYKNLSGRFDLNNNSVNVAENWSELSRTVPGDDPVLHGDLEVMSLPGPAMFPAAILVYDQKDQDQNIVLATRKRSSTYKDGVKPRLIELLSHRARIERSRTVPKTHEDLVEKFPAQGINE